MKTIATRWGSLVAVIGLAGCSIPVTLNTVQSFDVKTAKLDAPTAFKRITNALVDRGFDIKTSDKDAGLVTTEYKKFASIGDAPPFDYYMQIKALIREAAGGDLAIKLAPTVKEQNRLNAAAYSEHELSYYTGEPDRVRLVQSMRPGGWRAEAQIMFMNVVSDVAQASGVSVDEIAKNVTTTPANAFLAK